MNKRTKDLCPQPYPTPQTPLPPHVPPIFPASVYRCRDPDETRQLLEGELDSYVYQRDGHPNADVLAQRCQELHRADWAVVTSSGMSALAAAILSGVSQGDHILASDQLYGHSLRLILRESRRLGIQASVVDTTDLAATKAALRQNTRLIVVETITNPLLRVVDISALASLAADAAADLLVDNTFATPLACQPLTLGADIVVESISKMINGHSDVMLGMLAGRHADPASSIRGQTSEQRARDVISVWGLASSPFDCWLAARGLTTLHLRFAQACDNARQVAEFLSRRADVSHVHYPGLPTHPDYDIAQQQFGETSGWMVTFNLTGGATAAQRFISTAGIPFCPSLGEVDTTLSHPASTSHRGLATAEQEQLGIHGGTIRLSVGTESAEHVLELVEMALDRV
jgi:cystathionine beta-lyase/cystathionine gamma-synthase